MVSKEIGAKRRVLSKQHVKEVWMTIVGRPLHLRDKELFKKLGD